MTQQAAKPVATNTLYGDILCPHCGSKVTSGIGFRVGVINRHSYNIGEKLSWDGGKSRPAERPAGGNLQTIGYFECDNLKCKTWEDCYPEIQEALITVKADVITEAKPTVHKPNELLFDIIESKDVP